MGLCLLAVELALEFTFARGLFYPTVRQLPFLRALHVNPRFGSAFILPLAMLEAWAFSRWAAAWTEKRSLAVFLPLNLLILASLGAYELLPLGALQQRNYDLSGLIQVYEQINQGETFPIEAVGDVTDQRVFDQQTSNIKPYEVLFGYDRATFKPQVLPGPAREVRDGAFNLTNPAALVYPEVNAASPWSRIPESQRAELEDFLAHRQPGWPISTGQKAANWISLAALVANFGLLGYGLFSSKLRKS